MSINHLARFVLPAAMAAAVFWSSALSARAAETDQAKRPNILLIITDQQQARMMSCAGNPYVKTPAMDALAARGVRFERAYCGNPVCVPSRFSMMTGTLPSRIGMDRNGPNSKPITSEILDNAMGYVFSRAGYETVYGGKVHLPGAKDGVKTYGFEEYLTKDEREALADSCVEFLGREHKQPFLLVASLINPHDICYMAIDAYTRSAGKSLDFPNSPRERLCLAEALQLPRGVAREEFFAKVCPPLPENFEIPPGEPPAVRDSDWRPFRRYAQEEWTAEDWRLHRWAYARLTERVDAQIGQVLDALKRSGLDKNTVVVFTSDHGDMDSAHRLEHKSMPYEEATRVPLIVSCPETFAAPAVDKSHLVSTGLDLIPTLCDFAGIAKPAALQGRSVKPLVLASEASGPWRKTLVTENERSRVLWSEHFKYAVYDHGQPREMLIDPAADPGEMNNLATDPSHRDVLMRHRQLLRQWYRHNGETLDPEYVVAE